MPFSTFVVFESKIYIYIYGIQQVALLYNQQLWAQVPQINIENQHFRHTVRH